MSGPAAGRRPWWPLPVALLLGALAGLAFSLGRGPVYTADAYITVVPADPAATASAVNYAQAYARIATEPEILAVAAHNAAAAGGGGASPAAASERLRRGVRASASPDAPLVELSASAADPVAAAEQVNTVADALISYAGHHAAATRVRLVGFTKAFPPAAPSTPPPVLTAAVGAAGGVLIGGLACLAPPVPIPAARDLPLLRSLTRPRPALSGRGAL
ncbi:lipopolysaccharide biosynthesis protein [Planomonospora venezuelensis]|uniref:Uncharacterized protein involved in exopolysaccharide biosynthesis n=1 Tax=Planomonospora venezuelensis TaxID=1999 RepID=A0A841CXM9_PLAVE|nr:lipopolysaccharide biosynthesis protein [Planomonospora venezuelensis]MBB5962059.1 uncharacterized protein involved in exopolysaccharide biosynthesis [Planomonospora venezuelensis]GIN00161.1 hypothetical protein Pve01_18190 [Planomonospora venezuelensis]